MRVLKPEVAEERKRSVLRWVIHRYMKTASPVSSQTLAQEADFKLSPATLRHVLKELEEEGHLFQGHASAGRIPTDKGYRLYVDDLVDMQKIAAQEKHRIETEYTRRVAELDELLVQTSRMLSSLSHSAGFALSPRLAAQPVERIELVPLGSRHVLLVLLTHSGLIRHWPLEVGAPVAPERLRLLGRFLNENLRGTAIGDIQKGLLDRIDEAEKEFRDLNLFARRILGRIAEAAGPEDLYVDGTSTLASLPAADPDEVRALLKVVEDRARLARILQEEFEEGLARYEKQGARRAPGRGRKGRVPSKAAVPPSSVLQVRIGGENRRELRSVSLVTSTYDLQDRMVGLLGILGPRHMEYPKMIALVRFVASVVSHTLARWDDVYGGPGAAGGRLSGSAAPGARSSATGRPGGLK